MAFKRTSITREEGRFRSNEEEAAYAKYCECMITLTRPLVQDKINYPISDLFTNTSLLFLITLSYPFHSKMLYEFFANLIINSERTTLQSRVFGREVVITNKDLHELLHISMNGPCAHAIANDSTYNWSTINFVIRNSPIRQHQSLVIGLVLNARVIQHVLRHNVIPKAGDRTHITPLLSIVTYFCITNTQFNVADLLIRYIENLTIIKHPLNKQKHNLALGHMIAYLLEVKYNISYPEEPDHLPSHLTDKSFHTLYSEKRLLEKAATHAEEVEEAPIHEKQDQSFAHYCYPQDTWTEHFARIEMKVDRHIKEQRSRWEQYQKQREQDKVEHEEERAWFEAQFDSIYKLFRPLPPYEGPSRF